MTQGGHSGSRDHQLEMIRQLEAEDVCQPEAFMHLFNSQLEAVVCVVFRDESELPCVLQCQLYSFMGEGQSQEPWEPGLVLQNTGFL